MDKNKIPLPKAKGDRIMFFKTPRKIYVFEKYTIDGNSINIAAYIDRAECEKAAKKYHRKNKNATTSISELELI